MPWIPSREKCQKIIADVLFPEANTCHLCGRFLGQAGLLCSRCADELMAARFKKLHIVSADPHAPLAVCLAAYPHRDKVRELVHLFKYQSDCVAAELLAESMTDALISSPARPEAIDTVIPVPLHVSRLEQRGYNQALLLAQAVCAHTGLELTDGVLIRIHATDTQIHRSRAERFKAMQHAFAVTDPVAVRGRHILLVDDVLTTGATAMACAEALTGAGAVSVSLLTACRT